MIFLLIIPLLGSCHADLLLGTGGITGAGEVQSEVLDVIRNLNCSAPPPYPVEGVCFSVVSSPQGVLVCGGNDNAEIVNPGTTDCYSLSDNKWVKGQSHQFCTMHKIRGVF